MFSVLCFLAGMFVGCGVALIVITAMVAGRRQDEATEEYERQRRPF